MYNYLQLKLCKNHNITDSKVTKVKYYVHDTMAAIGNVLNIISYLY